MPMGFHDQRYPYVLYVDVTLPGYPDAPFTDAVKGLSAGHALWRARDNWPGATVTPAQIRVG